MSGLLGGNRYRRVEARDSVTAAAAMKASIDRRRRDEAELRKAAAKKTLGQTEAR